MTHELGKRGTSFALFTLVMVALLVGLGLWQLQRRVEKHALIAALSGRLAAAPSPLPSPSQWSALTRRPLGTYATLGLDPTYRGRGLGYALSAFATHCVRDDGAAARAPPHR